MQASSSKTTEKLGQLSLNNQGIPSGLPRVRIKARECDKYIAVIIPIIEDQHTTFGQGRINAGENTQVSHFDGKMSDNTPALFVAVPRLRIAELHSLLKTVGASDDGIVQKLLKNSIDNGDGNEPVSPRLGAAYNFYTSKSFVQKDNNRLSAEQQKSADAILQRCMLLRAKSDVLWKKDKVEISNFGKNEINQALIKHLNAVQDIAKFMYQDDTNFDINKFLTDGIVSGNKITAETLLKTGIIKQNDNVLDVGAGYCAFGNTLKNNDIHVTSIEPAPELYQNYCHEHTPNHDVVNATVQQYAQSKKQYDVVHIGNISPSNRLTKSKQDMQNYFKDFFQHAKQLVSPNGQMLVGIANVNPEYIMIGKLHIGTLLKNILTTLNLNPVTV